MASVIIMGLGKMGSAFARRLVQTNNSVCVWNRSEEKMKEIVGAIPASSPEAALTENQNALIVTFFSTDVVTRNVLFTPTVAPLLRGRALLNLASGNPDDGRSMHKELGTHGLTCYLDGAYCGPPVTIERGTGTLFLNNLPTDMTKYILNTFESVGGGPDGPNQGNDWTRIQEVMRFPKQHVPK
eukprot:NODE_8770_length_683_cov_84.866071_g4382_i1.p1 GENE.NODE_8770_length_683_cov_84.866071_g4382_i1~~NODE_8770_length_683_cov_84.866071_g4382_i1.p1  ORF type:complete len:184 (+),score=33.30 NODE_8770_length_683_cov_84.866071_g4382_i1:63-614(+)